ncbi:MAG: CHASE3 domain-containing protein, partial [Chloroflexi bacterium]|nr:CHASE3 domain-containing protein [Chloroflexota bacterium]
MGFLDSFKIGPKIIGGYVIAALAMAILAYMLLGSISGLNSKFNFLVHHDTPVLTNAQHLTGLMVDMETGLRGYMVTGQTGYLDPYNNGKVKFDEVMAAEQELTSDNPSAVAKLKAVHELEQEWLTGYSVPAIALREEVESGAVAQAHFAEISARTIGKEKFDGIREILGGITAKFEAADDQTGRFLMESITLDLVNMETGQRGFLLTGEDASLDPYVQGQQKLTEDIQRLTNHDYAAAGVSSADINGIQAAVTGWKDAAAQPEIDARIQVRNFPKTMADIIALVNSGRGKESMDVIRADLGEFLASEVALNEIRADEVAAQASSAQTMGIGVAVA